MPVYHTYTDEQLLQLLKSADRQAFATLFERYHRPLYLNVMRSVRNTADAEDIVQEVFFTLWEKRASLSADRAINGWLFTLSYHRTVDLLRKKLREQQHLQFLAAEEAMPGADPAFAEEQYALLEAAIQSLSPQKKRVFECCKLQGYSYEKAAAELGISRHTVGEYLKEAMASIREYMHRHATQGSATLSMAVLAIFLS